MKRFRDQRGSLLIELMIALGILTAVLVPLSFAFMSDRQQCRAAYVHAIAMELVDGEMETLVAGEWRTCSAGEHPYPLHGAAAGNLPPGHCTLTVQDRHLRLEWQPVNPRQGHGVVREAVGR